MASPCLFLDFFFLAPHLLHIPLIPMLVNTKPHTDKEPMPSNPFLTRFLEPHSSHVWAQRQNTTLFNLKSPGRELGGASLVARFEFVFGTFVSPCSMAQRLYAPYSRIYLNQFQPTSDCELNSNARFGENGWVVRCEIFIAIHILHSFALSTPIED